MTITQDKSQVRVFPEIEIDLLSDQDFGDLFRVWKGSQIIGTFFQSLDGKWVSQPFFSTKRQRWNSSEDAVNEIVNAAS